MRSLVSEGKLGGEARVLRIDDDTEHRIDTAFSREYRAAMSDKTKARAEQIQQEKAKKQPFFGKAIAGAIVLGGIASYAYYWYSERLTCSRDSVTKVVSEIVKEKLLKATKGSVTIYSIATLGSLDNGGVKCSANADIKDTETLFDGLHEIEYTAEARGNDLYVTSRFTR